MERLKLICLLLALTLCFQNVQAQEFKHAGLTGKEKTIVIQPTRSDFTYTLNVVVNNCEIDGNIYVDCGSDSEPSVATYHVKCENGQWVWGCGGHCYTHGGGLALYENCNITQQDLFDLVLMIHDADTCCRGTGPEGHPCDTMTQNTEDLSEYGICHKIDVVCCGNAMKIIYTQFNCNNQNEIINVDEFWALYDGSGAPNVTSSYAIIGVQGSFSEGMRNRILYKILQDDSNLCDNSTNN